MGKSLGIAAFVILLFSFPVPLVGAYVNFLALIIAIAAAWAGDKTWTITTVVVSFVHLFFLSPTWHVAMFASSYMRATNSALSSSPYLDTGTRQVMAGSTNAMGGINSGALSLTLLFLIAPIVVLGVRGARSAKPNAAGDVS